MSNDTTGLARFHRIVQAMKNILDDDLTLFERNGAAPLPPANEVGQVEREGARLWYASYGLGPAVLLLHGGLGHSGNWGYQVPALVESGYRAVLIDSRGHGRSTRDARPFSYDLMASDAICVMDALGRAKAAVLGWSDGACTGLVLAEKVPERVAGVFFFACNVDPSGLKPFEMTPTVQRCFNRHARDYADLSPTPERFDDLVKDLAPMQQTQPNYSAFDLAKIAVPVAVVLGEREEFIEREHGRRLARTIPRAEFVLLDGVSHFAPLQRPHQFNKAVLAFLGKVLP
jgi:pimeloyl-ACP methyl ester carboxylesterase